MGEFGEEILRADGEIDRAKLGALVFSDPEALHRLESIVHPAVGAEIEQQLSDLGPSTSDFPSRRHRGDQADRGGIAQALQCAVGGHIPTRGATQSG